MSAIEPGVWVQALADCISFPGLWSKGDVRRVMAVYDTASKCLTCGKAWPVLELAGHTPPVENFYPCSNHWTPIGKERVEKSVSRLICEEITS